MEWLNISFEDNMFVIQLQKCLLRLTSWYSYLLPSLLNIKVKIVHFQSPKLYFFVRAEGANDPLSQLSTLGLFMRSTWRHWLRSFYFICGGSDIKCFFIWVRLGWSWVALIDCFFIFRNWPFSSKVHIAPFSGRQFVCWDSGFIQVLTHIEVPEDNYLDDRSMRVDWWQLWDHKVPFKVQFFMVFVSLLLQYDIEGMKALSQIILIVSFWYWADDELVVCFIAFGDHLLDTESLNHSGAQLTSSSHPTISIVV